LLLSLLVANGEIIPATNRVDWAIIAGVEGGIRHRTTIYTNLDNGVDITAFNAAIANCPSNQVVMLTNKVFTLAGTVVLLNAGNGISLRGHGTSTVVACHGFSMGKDLSKGVINLHSGYTSGSSNPITLESDHQS
jgi:hypothetical protein